MKYLHSNLKVLTIILFFLLFLPSCNNEEIFIVEESAIIAEEQTEETPNSEDEAPPIDVVDDNVTTIENIAVDIEVHLNDENLPAAISINNTNPTNGVLTINNNETPNTLIDDVLVYKPNTGFSGTDSFEYTICDATNADNCDTAIVTITIEPRENDIATELKAFPSAEGAGAYTTGGRGGTVLHVTSLADGTNSDVGTLRWALKQPYPRTVVFDVSGEIMLNSILWIDEGQGLDNLTIAGQTAPEGGITVRGYAFGTSIDNFIIRYITFRGDKNHGSNRSAIECYNTNNAILDHVSVALSVDKDISFWADSGMPNKVSDVTIQRCLLGEAKNWMLTGSQTPSANDKAGNYSVHKNLFANASHRAPNVSGNALVEISNNVIYNWARRLSQTLVFSKINQINNYYKPGPNTNMPNDASIDYQRVNLIRSTELFPTLNGVKLYTDGNYYNNLPTLTNENWNAWSITDNANYLLPSSDYPNQPQPTIAEKEQNYGVVSPFVIGGKALTILSAQDAYTSVLADVGNNKYLNANGSFSFYQDSLDTTYINDVTNGVYANMTPPTGFMVEHSGAVYSYPVIPQNTRPAGYDTDNDGMADIWEIATFGNLTKDGTGDIDADGYTDLEEFLNLVDL